MRRVAALVLVVVVQTGDSRLPSVQTEHELRTLIGDEPQARAIIHQAIELFFIVALTAADAPRSVRVLAAQLPSAWLPQVHGVTLDRLDAQRAAREWDSGCLRLLSITAELSGGVLAVAVNEGNKCQRRRSVVEFTQTERGWQRGWGIRPTAERALTQCPVKTKVS
jgi:hypothetical protein